MPLIKNRRALYFGIETTPGTALAQNSCTGIFCYDPMIQPNITLTTREATGTIGRLPGIPGPRPGKCSFSIELSGGGSTAIAPPWVTLLTACGMAYNSTSHVLTPTSDPGVMQTVTLSTFQKGPTQALQKQLVGANGTVSLDGENGKAGMLKFDFTGIFMPPVDATMPTLPAFPTLVPPQFRSTTFTIGGYGPKISKFGLDFSNTVKLIEDITTSSGLAYGIVTDRDPKGSLDPMLTNVGTFDPHGLLLAMNTPAMSLALGNSTGNTITITAPALQFADNQEADREKLSTDDIKYNLTPVNGDDEFSIAFS